MGHWILSCLALAGVPVDLVAPDAPDTILGGTEVATCAWPDALAVESSDSTCTGSLVHPRLLITAAHCGDMSLANFGERWRSPTREVEIVECHRNPGWTGQFGTGSDFQYCLLAESVDDVPIVPILMGCETGILSPGVAVVAVGFGRTREDVDDYGTKREIRTALTSADLAEGTAWVAGFGGKSTCSGDSGGPLYVQLAGSAGGDDTWRVFGINSWKSGACENGTGFVLMHQAVPWIESDSGIDITPCHDADGTWAPGPDCGFFPLDPGTGVGAWPSCAGGPVSGPSSLCGPAASGDDLDAPRVAVVEPHDGARVEPDGTGRARVMIAVEADDGDGWGIAEVHLEIDGDPGSGTGKRVPPFSWNAQFAVGTYTVVAVAVDRAGNEARAQVVFGVGEDPGPGPGTSTGTGTSEGDETGAASSGVASEVGDGSAGADDGAGTETAGLAPAEAACGCRHGFGRAIAAGPWLLTVAVRRRSRPRPFGGRAG